MSDRHRIQITGNIGKDDPKRHDTEQFQEAKCSIAVSNSYKSPDGWKEVTTWYHLAFYNRLAEKAMSLKSGDKVLIDGHISIKRFIGKDGNEVEYRKIVVDDFYKLASEKRKGAENNSAPIDGFPDDDIPF
jgi:single stranded DNA-binding protein